MIPNPNRTPPSRSHEQEGGATLNKAPSCTPCARGVQGSALLFALVFCHVAQAQDANPNPSAYEVEFSTGPLIAPSNVVGMGGAFIAIAEGSAGMQFNPAAVANRYHYNGDQWFDWDFTIDWLNVGAGASGADVFRDGREGTGRQGNQGQATLLTAGFGLMFGRLGVGLQLSNQELSFCRSGGSGGADPCALAKLTTQRGGFAVGYNFWDGELVAGLQISGALIDLDEVRALEDSALVFGALWKPRLRPLRVGLTASLPFNDDTVNAIEGITAPKGVAEPWRVGVGFAYAWGPRTFNPAATFDDPPEHMEAIHEAGEAVGVVLREEADAALMDTRDLSKHRYITASADLVLIGPSPDAMGLRGWLAGEVQRAGQDLSVGVHTGVESEFWADRMRARAGAYWEPSRYEDTTGRIHGTAGLDLRVIDWLWRWRASGAVDVADDYFNYMLSVGFWH